MHTEVTQDEIKTAYLDTCLPEAGISFEYAMKTKCVKTCLTNLAISMRKRTNPATPPTKKHWWQKGQMA